MANVFKWYTTVFATIIPGTKRTKGISWKQLVLIFIIYYFMSTTWIVKRKHMTEWNYLTFSKIIKAKVSLMILKIVSFNYKRVLDWLLKVIEKYKECLTEVILIIRHLDYYSTELDNIVFCPLNNSYLIQSWICVLVILALARLLLVIVTVWPHQ